MPSCWPCLSKSESAIVTLNEVGGGIQNCLAPTWGNGGRLSGSDSRHRWSWSLWLTCRGVAGALGGAFACMRPIRGYGEIPALRRATMALESLLEEADVVTLHVTLTDETRGFIGRSALKRMKPTAILFNTSRGAVVDVDALCDALEIGSLAGAALDVLPEEPPGDDARVLGLGDKVLLSPHMVSANAPGTLDPAIPGATDAILRH
ncbi:MAG: hypothetical protein CM1200mP36_00410 [Gammaproteobacteria bacterium]|nr:MAG: hypothetical protein CM1200mP36_00410 [Gammaproteobacteria bacterium]